MIVGLPDYRVRGPSKSKKYRELETTTTATRNTGRAGQQAGRPAGQQATDLSSAAAHNNKRIIRKKKEINIILYIHTNIHIYM